MNAVGILPGNRQSYIDHLVPLCQILEIPLLVTDTWIKELIEIYYPPMKIIVAQPLDYNLDPFLKGYDTFVYVDFFRRGNGTFQFQEYISRHKAHSIMSLHGNPDKYWQMHWLEQMEDEETVLAYGPQLRDLLKQKGVRKVPLICGNYRLEYYKSQEAFFDSKLPFQKQRTTLLYAPSWTCSGRTTEYRNYYSSFFEVCDKVFTLSEHFQLIVKLHPHFMQLMPEKIEQIMHCYPHICFLNDFPPIYPLLKIVDLYLGDYSSIGYDFLYFDRPLYFLETDQPTALHNYGERVEKGNLYPFPESKYERCRLYREVFGEEKNINQLRRELENVY